MDSLFNKLGEGVKDKFDAGTAGLVTQTRNDIYKKMRNESDGTPESLRTAEEVQSVSVKSEVGGNLTAAEFQSVSVKSEVGGSVADTVSFSAHSIAPSITSSVKAKRQIKKGALEDIYPWISLLPPKPGKPSSKTSTPTTLGLDPAYYNDLQTTPTRDGEEEIVREKETPDEIQEKDEEGSPIDTRGLVPPNIDDRGRIRGGCEDCDCDEFERAPKGAACYYCACSPTCHELLWPPPSASQKAGSEGENESPVSGAQTPAPKTRMFNMLRTKFENKQYASVTENKALDNKLSLEPFPESNIGIMKQFKKKIRGSPPPDDFDEVQEVMKVKRAALEIIKKDIEKELEDFEEQKKVEFEQLKEVWSELYFKELPDERVDKDKRGILRGRCRDCDCDGFESDLPTSSHCSYCGCAPTYHVAKVDYFTSEPYTLDDPKWVNDMAIKRWKRRQLSGITDVAESSELGDKPGGSVGKENLVSGTVVAGTVVAGTVYENQQAVEAAAANMTYLSSDGEYAPPKAGSVVSFDVRAEKMRLSQAEKKRTNVAEIYPWIQTAAEPKKKATTIKELVRENKMKGLSKRHNLILDLTEEVRTLRKEVEDVLFYDNEDTLQEVLEELWVEHHKLIQQFEEFMVDLTVDSPPATPLPASQRKQTPDALRSQRFYNRIDTGIRNMFRITPVDDKVVDSEFKKSEKPSKYGIL